jgi:4-alpha-glucanotransferase
MSSVADLFVVQMQDYLGLGAEARMNTPGILGGNWQWRMEEDQIDEDLIEKIAEYARIYGRDQVGWEKKEKKS